VNCMTQLNQLHGWPTGSNEVSFTLGSCQKHQLIPLGDHGLALTSSRKVAVLNPVARAMLEAIRETNSMSNATTIVSRRFGVDPARVDHDTRQFLDSFENATAGESISDVPPRKPVRRRSEWSNSCSLLVGHADIRLRFSSPELASWVTPHWRHFTVGTNSPASVTLDLVNDGCRVSLYRNGVWLDTAADFGTARGWVHREIIQAVYEARHWAAVLHAAAVSDRRGALVIAAESGAGKSTLTAALIRAGFNYLGDDCVPLLRSSHEAVSVPTAVRLRQGSWSTLRNYVPELSILPAETTREGVYKYWHPIPARSFAPISKPVRGLLFVRYRSGSVPSIKRLSPVQAFCALVRSGSSVGEPLTAERLADWAAWIERTPAIAIEYDSLNEALNLVSEAFPK
jgi:hypothetical protein